MLRPQNRGVRKKFSTPYLDLSVCFILPLHDNDTNIKREQKRSSSSKHVEELNNDIKIVKRHKTDHLFFPRKYDYYFSRLKMLTSFYNIKGGDKIHTFSNNNNTRTRRYIRHLYFCKARFTPIAANSVSFAPSTNKFL